MKIRNTYLVLGVILLLLCIGMAFASAQLSTALPEESCMTLESKDPGIGPITATSFTYSSKLVSDPKFLTVSLMNQGDYPGKISADDSVSNIGGKRVVFKGGGVSGGANFAFVGYLDEFANGVLNAKAPDGYENIAGGGGGCPASAIVKVRNAQNELIAEIALPINTDIGVDNVEEIELIVAAPIPGLTDEVTYFQHWWVDAQATVVWQEYFSYASGMRR